MNKQLFDIFDTVKKELGERNLLALMTPPSGVTVEEVGDDVVIKSSHVDNVEICVNPENRSIKIITKNSASMAEGFLKVVVYEGESYASSYYVDESYTTAYVKITDFGIESAYIGAKKGRNSKTRSVCFSADGGWEDFRDGE